MFPRFSSCFNESRRYIRDSDLTASKVLHSRFHSPDKLKSSKSFALQTLKRHSIIFSQLVAVACCVAQVLPWTFKFASTGSSILCWIDQDVRNNTSWKNVQFNSGVFGQGLSELSGMNEQHIVDQCNKLTGWTWYNDPDLFDVDCVGPLATNASCCYCYLSGDFEQVNITNSFKYWSSAVARNPSLLPLNSTRVDTHGRKVALITGKFGHGNLFKTEVDDYCGLVRNMRIFDPNDIHCFWDSPDYVLQNPKFSRHLRYRSEPNDLSSKGGGFWFHKSVLLRHHLDVYMDGDYLVYTDVDRFDFFRFGTFHAVVETVAKRGDDLSIEIFGEAAEVLFTKEDVLAAFNASEHMRESPQVLANMVVVRNSPKMKLFMDAWVECAANWHMISDEPSILPNGPRYLDHRHDQSILSLLVKTFMTIQGVVGPPARPFQHASEILTYRFREGADPTCPFLPFSYSGKVREQK